MEKLKVTLQDRPIDDELAQYKRMFESACSALAAISDALLVDPEEGGVEPILAAIADLKDSALQPVKQEPVVNDADRSDAYDVIDRFLRNNLDDSDYEDYSTALDTIYAAPVKREWVDLTDDEIDSVLRSYTKTDRYKDDLRSYRAVIAAFKEKNQ